MLAGAAARRCVDMSYLIRGVFRARKDAIGISLEHLAIAPTVFVPEGRTIVHSPDFLPDRYTFAGDPFETSPHFEFAREYLAQDTFNYAKTRYYKLAARGKLARPGRGKRQARSLCRQFIYLINAVRKDGYQVEDLGLITLAELEDGAFMVLDGKHRLAALLALKVDQFPVVFCFDNEIHALWQNRIERSWPPYFYRKSRSALNRIGKPLHHKKRETDQLIGAIKGNHLANLGEVYHPIPFREFQGLTTQVRPTASYKRLGMILCMCSDFRGKRILDLGCNVGFYSFSLAKRGAVVTALDLVPERIDLARTIAEIYETPVDFQERPATPEFFEQLGERFDAVLCFSMLQWVIAQDGREAGDRLLRAISDHSDSIFFDVPINRGKACLVCRPGEELAFVHNLLRDATSYDEVRHVGDVHPYGADTRHVFFARHRS